MTSKHFNRRDSLQWLAASAMPTAWLGNQAHAAQPPATDYPTRASKLIIPFPAGGATDYAAARLTLHCWELTGSPKEWRLGRWKLSIRGNTGCRFPIGG